jgi:hypothetical protein
MADRINKQVSGRNHMFNAENLQRIATGLAGAILLSTACVTAAVGPAQAAGTGQANVQVSGQVRA